MIQIKENFSLKEYNTLGIDVKSRYFVRTKNIDELKYVLGNHKECFPFYIMGGGSNILFTKDFNGIIIQPDIKGINIIENDNKICLVEVGAGVNWDDFVSWAVENKLGGIENLSLIPGSTGSSPIQNIGAYGVEVKDVIEKVNFLDLETLELASLMNHECQFDYRNSIFKNHLKNRIVITSVVFRLLHTPVFNLSYGNLQEEINIAGKATLKTVRDAVINIRRSKLPDPKELGNAGSFFKNPVLDIATVKQLKDQFISMPVFPVSDELAKIPAGWLIEQCGWKGKRTGNAGVHDKQALVLVNHGNASGEELKNLAMQISDSVFSKFKIQLEPEVNII
ncbi:MAG: UDP-N-acetylmuramate dehydrogenase [Bacteroidales bacterium]